MQDVLNPGPPWFPSKGLICWLLTACQALCQVLDTMTSYTVTEPYERDADIYSSYTNKETVSSSDLPEVMWSLLTKAWIQVQGCLTAVVTLSIIALQGPPMGRTPVLKQGGTGQVLGPGHIWTRPQPSCTLCVQPTCSQGGAIRPTREPPEPTLFLPSFLFTSPSTCHYSPDQGLIYGTPNPSRKASQTSWSS